MKKGIPVWGALFLWGKAPLSPPEGGRVRALLIGLMSLIGLIRPIGLIRLISPISSQQDLPPFGGTEGGFLRDYSGASVNFTFPLMSVLELPTYAVKRPGSLTQS